MEKSINIRKSLLISFLLMLGMAALFLFYRLGNNWEFALQLRSVKVITILIVAGSVAYSSVA
ncbi:MAG TPA: hypothetical protein VKX35_10135, partial [Fermentimonas sp.]|nr:hypothetical protein [Fermentimonas sp.]